MTGIQGENGTEGCELICETVTTQRSNWVTWCWFACKWDAASRVTWSRYSAAGTHRCSIPRGQPTNQRTNN